MGATHSSQHTKPDAKHSSTRCCPTHEMWELPTPLIVTNRSQQGDEVYGSYPHVLNRHFDKISNIEHIPRSKAYTAASIITHAQSKAAKQAHIRTSSLLRYNYYKAVPSNTDIPRSKAYTAASIITHAQSKAAKQAHIRTSSLLRYNYYKAVPSNTDITPSKPNTDTNSGTIAQKLRIGSYKLNQICPTLLTQQKTLSKAQGRILTLTQQATSTADEIRRLC
ncbi:gibberellin 2-beta-dioxygenase 8 [Dorcoceras hygrometricum]|uniref:Gibberellin 2-beta-dioxygenase 8 n=1 Tax=Dorcoceras hygrometricum TaxID=472368 RepID=A0A2Z7BL01_9LAMI|nr:gibberellin 2-beta-dioxygenase 8 [Dorcoceras hygrometricum]